MLEISIDIGDDWVEPLYEHVHHGRCFSLLERARLALLQDAGVPNESLVARGHVLVITRVEASYKREVKRGVVRVTCDSLEVRERALVIRQRIVNERGKVAVEAEVESVFMDLATRRGMLPPQDFLDAIAAYVAKKLGQ